MVGWVAIALVAVSPFHVLYAQTARPYSLWTLTTLLSSAALLRALKFKTIFNWGVYAIALALGLYSHLFTILIAIGHGIYTLITERFRLNQVVVSYLFASFARFLAFVPWVAIVLINLDGLKKTSSWALEDTSASNLINEWLRNISYGFVDFWYIFTYFPDSTFNFGFGKFFIPLILALIAYSTYFLYRNTSERIWLFILTLIGVTALALTLPDLLFSGYRSIMAKYFVPCYIGMQLTVAYLLATKIRPVGAFAKTQQRNVWKFITVILISSGVLSCVISSQAEVWWVQRTIPYDLLRSASIINQSSHPLLMLERGFGIAANLTYQLNSKTSFQFINIQNIPAIPSSFSDIFLLNYTGVLKPKFEKKPYRIKLAYKGRKKNLWKIEKE